MALIKVKRGTVAQIQAANLSLGEPAFASDTNELYISDGVNANLIGHPIANIIANRPAAGSLGRMFYATDTQFLYIDEVTQWRQFDPVGIQKYDLITADADAGVTRAILVDASANDINITLGVSSQIDGRTYAITRTDESAVYSVFIVGDSISWLIGDPNVAIGAGYGVGGMSVTTSSTLEIMWVASTSTWEQMNKISGIDGGVL